MGSPAKRRANRIARRRKTIQAECRVWSKRRAAERNVVWYDGPIGDLKDITPRRPSLMLPSHQGQPE
jgi:hypothetical protein